MRPGHGIRLSPWLEVQPWARLGATYDSNVFRSAFDERDDVLCELGGGIEAVAKSRHFSAGAGYTINRRTYLTESGLDSFDHLLHAELGAREIGLLEEARAGGSLVIETRPADPRLQGDGGVVDRTSADLDGAATLRIVRWWAVRAEGDLTYEDQEPSDPIDASLERFDHEGWAGRGILDLRPRQNLSFLAGAEVRDLIYTNEEQAVAPDLRVVGGFVGGEVRGRRLSAELRLGWEEAEVLKERGDPRASAPRGPTMLLRLGWQATRLTLVSLEAQRHIDFSTTNSSQTTTSLGAELRQSLSRTVALELRLGWEQRDPEIGSTLNVVRAGVGVGWRVLEWLSVGGEVGWDHWRRSQDDEVDAFRVGAWVMVAP
jgi:hypothetical protein